MTPYRREFRNAWEGRNEWLIGFNPARVITEILA
jgi:hypothetical protein